MERTARFAGYEVGLEKTERGYQVKIQTTPEHDQAREEVFALFDQLRASARRTGVTSPEIMAHWARQQWKRFSFPRK